MTKRMPGNVLDPRPSGAGGAGSLSALGLEAVLPGSLRRLRRGPTAPCFDGQGTLAQQLEQYGLGQAASPSSDRSLREHYAAVQVREGASMPSPSMTFPKQAGRTPCPINVVQAGRPISCRSELGCSNWQNAL